MPRYGWQKPFSCVLKKTRRAKIMDNTNYCIVHIMHKGVSLISNHNSSQLVSKRTLQTLLFKSLGSLHINTLQHFTIIINTSKLYGAVHGMKYHTCKYGNYGPDFLNRANTVKAQFLKFLWQAVAEPEQIQFWGRTRGGQLDDRVALDTLNILLATLDTWHRSTLESLVKKTWVEVCYTQS